VRVARAAGSLDDVVLDALVNDPDRTGELPSVVHVGFVAFVVRPLR
jgi:hypothetical protein